MKINEETTVSEEQILFNKLSYEDQQFILKQMRMLQPCEISCELEEEKKIPKKLKTLNNVGNVPNLVEFADKQQLNNHLLKDKINEIIDYLKSKGE